jgi:hypothetical protein
VPGSGRDRTAAIEYVVPIEQEVGMRSMCVAHEWRLWRPHLYEFAQLLFTERKAGKQTS